MPRSLLVLAVLVLPGLVLPGCQFDEYWQLESALPRTVALVNESQASIDLKEVSSSPDATGTFILTGEQMAPGSTLSWPIQMDAYEDFLSGRFVLYGACGDIDPWERAGAALRPHITRQEELGQVTITVPACNGR